MAFFRYFALAPKIKILASKIDTLYGRSLSLLMVGLLFSSTTFLWGQADSVAFKKAAHAFQLAFNNPDSALLLAKDVLNASGKNTPAKANAYNSLGWAYLHKGDMDSSLSYLKKSLEIFSKLNSNFDMARVAINISEAYSRKSEFHKSLQYVLRADSISRLLHDIGLLTHCKRQLGIIYRELGDNEKAAAFFEAALKGFEAQHNYAKYIDVVVSLSILFRNMNQPDSSMQIVQHAIKLAEKHHASPYQKAMLQEHLAESYIMKQNYQQALAHYTNAYNSFLKLNNLGDIAYEAFSIGNTLTLLSRYSEAEKYLLEAYSLSDSLDMLNFQVEILEALTKMHSQQHHWQQAFQYAQQTAALKDSFNLSKRITATNEIKEKYESEKKEAQIQLLNVKNNRIKWLWLASLLSIALAGAAIWLYQSRRKIKEEKILNYFATSLYNQNTVDDVFSDIVKNCVAKLDFESCIIYSYNEHQKMLVRKAGYAPKYRKDSSINYKIEIPRGKGIVGTVANTLNPEIIADTTKDSRYIAGDQSGRSEITVPILLDGKLAGIIDSEHHKKNFYTQRHLRLLQRIAATCSKKLTKYFIEDQIRKQIASDLHDDIGSELSSIDISSRTALIKKNDAGFMAVHLKAISHQAHQTMENMSDIVWSINPENDSFENILMRMKEFATELCDPLDINVQFLNSIAAEPHIVLNSIIRKNVFLIFKEAINNAAKYSGCSALNIRFTKQTPNLLNMEISDNGKGFNMETVVMGNGLRNMQDRAKQINANIKMDAAPDKGVSITLQVII